LGDYDHSNTLIIDPFKTNPAFTGYNAGYDVCYDLNGNVYAYGSFSWFQEAKINNLGALQWIFNAVFPSTWGGVQYGDFAVDEVNGTSYLTSSGYTMIIKVNTLGKQLDSMDVSGTMNEIWRMTYNRCENQIIIGGGGTAGNYQLASLDTSLISFKPVNVIATVGGHHDVYFLSIDNTNKYVYMATALSVDDGLYANDMEKVPITGFLPIQWSIADGYTFTESCCDANYVDGVGGHALGLNGIVTSPNWVYGYDGAKLRRYNKSTGTIVSTTVISPTKYSWGGIDVDMCDNLYLVNDTVVNIYDSALSVIGTIHPGYQVYDMHLMPDNQMCTAGKGFVSAFNITTNILTISKTSTDASCGKNNGSAFAQLVGCGNDSSKYEYQWSNGATTQLDTGLGIGVYTVTISSNCDFKYTDTVQINGIGNGGMTLSLTETNVPCFGDSNGKATVIVSGGKAPYTYSWTPNVGTTSTVSNLKAGSYQLTVYDSAGCNSILVTITQPAPLVVIAPNTPIECFGANSGTATAAAVGGTTPYTYLWSPSGITSANATDLSAGCYTVTVTDANGCNATTSTCITTAPALTVSVVNTPVKCNGGATGTATATAGGGSGAYTYNWSPSGGTGASANNLTATTYTITVTDKNGCTITASTSVTQPVSAL
ncbi:MAG TPA: SprB repeat-containing protein, partial [Bacteroidia bacterium]|nr:SprB repeat-containing protein [Bacteroidia bacterium]